MMTIRKHLPSVSWALADQGIASAGSFLTNIVLARALTPTDYGRFSLLFGALATLQLVNLTLLLYPLSVRLPVARSEHRADLLGATMMLIVFAALLLSLPLTVGLLALGAQDLIVPAICWFLLWQVQEGLRRGLLAAMRPHHAVPGDAVSYLGQAVLVGGISLGYGLTLPHALYALAATSGLAAILQFRKQHLRMASPARLRHIARDYWSIGGFWSLGIGTLGIARIQILPWLLATTGGSTAALQAVSNLVNLSNIVLFGLCNIIPQTAAAASHAGARQAWRATRGCLLLAAPPLFLFSLLLVVAPGPILSLFYGGTSPYAGLSTVLRVLAVVTLVSNTAELLNSFLGGVRALRLAFMVNVVGTVGMLLLAPLLTGSLGLLGGCAALLGASLLRLAAAVMAVTSITGRQNRAGTGNIPLKPSWPAT